jgi:hypothetical protein
MYKLLSGVFLLLWGLWCLIAIIRGKKVQGLIFSNDSFLPKKILGKYYDPFMNLLLAAIGITAGLFLIINYF